MTQIRHIIQRAMAEPEYRAIFFSDFNRAVEGYTLDGRDTAALRALTPRELEDMVGRLFAHLIVPSRVSPHVMVIPSSQRDFSPEQDDIPIWLEPRFVFGNGTHETTRATLTTLESHIRPGDRMLDLGLGTGIQSIAAIQLGAESALGLDINPEAVEVARLNFRRNRVESAARAEVGSLSDILDNRFQLDDPTFDLIVANILTPVILEFIRQGIAGALRPAGRLIVSGIQQGNISHIVRALPHAGLEEIDRRMEGTWAALVVRRRARRSFIQRLFTA